MKRIILICVFAVLWSEYHTGPSVTRKSEQSTCPTPTSSTDKKPMCTFYYEKQDTQCTCNNGEIGNVFVQRRIQHDEPLKDDPETSDDDSRTLSKRVLNGLEVPFSDSITKSTFKAIFRMSPSKTGYCTVSFVEKSHLLATSAACCNSRNFPVGPRLQLTNGVTPFMVNVFARLVPGTYVPGKRNDFCMIILNKAVPDIVPLNISYTSSNADDTVNVYAFGPDRSDSSRMSTRLLTGQVTVESTDSFGVIRVKAKSASVCKLDSGGVSKNNGHINGIIMGNGTECTTWRDTIGLISEFKPLEGYIKDVIARFAEPPGEPKG